jgi:hypothetical protein
MFRRLLRFRIGVRGTVDSYTLLPGNMLQVPTLYEVNSAVVKLAGQEAQGYAALFAP